MPHLNIKLKGHVQRLKQDSPTHYKSTKRQISGGDEILHKTDINEKRMLLRFL